MRPKVGVVGDVGNPGANTVTFLKFNFSISLKCIKRKVKDVREECFFFIYFVQRISFVKGVALRILWMFHNSNLR